MNERSIRKKQLIAEGALHRAELLLARDVLRDGMRPQALGRNLVDGALAAVGRKPMLGLAHLDLPTIVPLLLSGVSLLRRRKPLLKILLRGAAAAAAFAGLGAFIVARRMDGSSTDVNDL
jgi:hypothetical protein